MSNNRLMLMRGVGNTAQLPSNLVNELTGSLTRLANLSSTLRTQRGDMVALGQVFMNLFPEQLLFGDLAGASPEGGKERRFLPLSLYFGSIDLYGHWGTD